MNRENPMKRLALKSVSVSAVKCVATLAVVASLAACGGGAKTQENPITSAPPVSNYSGPPAANADVQAFRINLWENIRANNRCGGCHNAGGQAPQFARNDDVNQAYTAANTVVNLTQPDQSRMVTKVAGGHNCWLAAASACADTLTVWIRNWAGAAASGGRQIELQEPPIKEVGASKSFPTDSALFGQYIYPVLTDQGKCNRCHSSTSAAQQSPFFAEPAATEGDPLAKAYEAAKAKINLDDPSQSRFVLRLRDEFHNCWTANCATDAQVMQTAIENFANRVPPPEVDQTLVTSKALTLYDGTVAAGGNRYDNNVIALYEFKTGEGSIAYDTSGVEPAINLAISGPAGSVTWFGGWGLNIKAGGKAQGTTAASRKLSDMITSTGEFSIELWAAPANVVQEDAYIFSYSGGVNARNVTVAQRAYQYEALVRSNRTGANGTPLLATNANDRDAQATLQHIVMTYDPVNGRRFYVNGVPTGDMDGQGGGSLSDWDDSYALVLGNETSSDRQWQGVLRLVAVHNRALNADQIQQNFAAGVGERYYMLFSVSHLVNVPKAYLMLEASQLDSYGYLFNKPTFISLDPNAQISDIPISGVRIGINGREAGVGQAYVPLSKTVSAANYQSGSGQLLSTIGTAIGLEKGPEQDEFFLSFERIGSNSHSVTEPEINTQEPPGSTVAQPLYGLRTFDEINASMSKITGVPVTHDAVAETYRQVKQSLPAVETLGTFVASQQSGIAQLAIEYCNALVENAGLRSSFFPGLDLSASPASNRNVIVNSLLTRAVGQNLNTEPTDTVPDHLDTLINALSTNGANSTTVTKAACAAVLGSAVITLH